MNVKPISEVLQRAEPAVHAPDLLVLQQSSNLYKFMAYQPAGLVDVIANSIARADREPAMAESTKFLELAASRNVSLAIAPEYSIPWDALVASLQNGHRPRRGCIWALGCESLPLRHIDRIKQLLEGVAQVLSENTDFQQATTQQYQNPMAYIFQTERQDGAGLELIVLVQFKTVPSGDAHNTESRGMLKGDDVYVFGAEGGNRLMTMICSDVFEFQDTNITAYSDRLLLLHLQLNNSPCDVRYTHYRNQLFGAKTYTELICLNWARGTKYREPPIAVTHDMVTLTGSTWYKKLKTGADTSDTRIASNDIKGLYFTWAGGLKCVAYQFCDKPAVFCLNATKVYHGAQVPGAASNLTGPEMTEFLQWSVEDQDWEPVARADDGFAKQITAVAPALDELLTLHEACPISVDRVTSITTGDLTTDRWHDPLQLASLSLQGDSVVQRITCELDERGHDYRMRHLGAAKILTDLRNINFEWPAEVSFLGNSYKLNWLEGYPHRNVYQEVDGKTKYATVVYLSGVLSADHIELKDRAIRKLLVTSLPDPGHVLDKNEQRDLEFEHLKTAKYVCILHLKGGSLVAHIPSYRIDILRPSNTQLASVTDASLTRRGAGSREGNHAD